MSGVRLLVILHPGRVTRHAMLSLADAARGLGVLGGTIEAGPIWDRITRAGAGHVQERLAIARELEGLCRRERVTHAVGYVGNLTFDFGLFPPTAGREADGPTGLFPSLGVRHLMLWTDHPEWAQSGAALDDPYRRLLAHPMHTHFVKSRCAAFECSEWVLGWKHVHAIDMAEDPALLRPARVSPAASDAVIIQSDAVPVPEAAARFLHEDDPDPAEITHAMLPEARGAWSGGAGRVIGDREASERLFDAWTSAKLGDVHAGLATLACSLDERHAPALAALRASPRAWYGAVTALRRLTLWRRSFWPAWLARRRAVELHGGTAPAPELASSHAGWVDYSRQAEVYGRGAACVTINAAHDEEGMTHKAFQIAASAGALVHHRTAGLEAAFDVGTEALAFERGPELLDAVDRVRGSDAERARLGDAGRARLERSHTWRQRLIQMLELSRRDAARPSATPAERVTAPAA